MDSLAYAPRRRGPEWGERFMRRWRRCAIQVWLNVPADETEAKAVALHDACMRGMHILAGLT